MEKIKSGNLVKYVGKDWTGVTPVGQVTLVNQALGIKILWDNVDWDYWYYSINDIEVITDEEYAAIINNVERQI